MQDQKPRVDAIGKLHGQQCMGCTNSRMEELNKDDLEKSTKLEEKRKKIEKKYVTNIKANNTGIILLILL